VASVTATRQRSSRSRRPGDDTGTADPGRAGAAVAGRIEVAILVPAGLRRASASAFPQL